MFIQFFVGQFPFPAKICLCLSATRKNSLKTLLTSHSGWTLDSDHVCRSHHSMTSIVRLYSNHKRRSTNYNARRPGSRAPRLTSTIRPLERHHLLRQQNHLAPVTKRFLQANDQTGTAQTDTRTNSNTLRSFSIVFSPSFSREIPANLDHVSRSCRTFQQVCFLNKILILYIDFTFILSDGELGLPGNKKEKGENFSRPALAVF